MANIPMDVVESCILPRLPVKTLVRFKCVSKSWKTLISSSKFLHLHHRHANRLLLVSLEDYTLQVNNLDSALKLPFVCPSPYPYNEQLPNFTDTMTVLASCEFFVLVSYWLSRISYSHLFLLNPSTLSCHRIPSQDKELSLSSLNFKYKLYFDEDNDDCKVVKIINFRLNDGEWVFEIEIYSCKTKMWRLIDHKLIPGPFYAVICNPVACVNNLLYVIVDHPITERRIRCFDIQAERWTNDIVYPHKVTIFPDLRVFDGSLCLLGNDPSDNDNNCVWVLKESWVKLMSNLGKTRYIPIAYRKGSRHEILCRRVCDSQLYWYNLKYKVATRAEFGGCAKNVGEYKIVDHICKESLINFHGRERVHTST